MLHANFMALCFIEPELSPGPLHLRTLWRYTNAAAIIIIFFKNTFGCKDPEG